MGTLASTVITKIRTVTAHDVDQQITDAQLLLFINSEYQRMRRALGDLIPDVYSKVTAVFTMTGGATSFDLSGAPTSVTDLGKIRSVELLDNGAATLYRSVPLVPFIASGVVGYLSWRQRGKTTIDFFPPELVSNQQFRVKYIAAPVALAVVGDTLDIPDGADDIIVERVAGRAVRNRFEEGDPHTALGQQLWIELRNSLIKLYPSTPNVVADVTGRY